MASNYNPVDIEKTAFITPFELYEFMVMPFNLAYMSGTFQQLMNRIFQNYLGKFSAVYLDNIIIYLKEILILNFLISNNANKVLVILYRWWYLEFVGGDGGYLI